MGAKPACLMRGHGITSAGASIEEATLTAIKLNEAESIIGRRSWNAASRFLRKISNHHGLATATEQEIGAHNSIWRYYCKLVDE